MNRVMVTGATGFLGRHVVEALTARRLEVHAVARSFADSHEFINAGVRTHTVDLFDTPSVESLMADVRPVGLIHLAWTTTPGDYWTDPANELWTAASKTLFEFFSSHGGRRIVVAGTSAEYAWPSEVPLDEETSPVQPASLYGRSKDSLRRHLEAWAPRAGVSWTWARLFNIYGRFEHPRRLIPQSIRSLLAGKPIPFDDGLAVRDFLHVADAADAFASLYQHPYSGVINVASGEGTTVREHPEAESGGFSSHRPGSRHGHRPARAWRRPGDGSFDGAANAGANSSGNPLQHPGCAHLGFSRLNNLPAGWPSAAADWDAPRRHCSSCRPLVGRPARSGQRLSADVAAAGFNPASCAGQRS